MTATATKKKKQQHLIQQDPLYSQLNAEEKKDIDKDVQSIARQEAVNGAVKYGLLALVVVLVLMSLFS